MAAPADSSSASTTTSSSSTTQQLRATQQSSRWSRCVDLGCGTGLMGPLLRQHTAHLSGVDLSQGMVAKARERGCYDELGVGELVQHLTTAAALQSQGERAQARLCG
jgi:predicted TPR repeat methyltransferase